MRFIMPLPLALCLSSALASPSLPAPVRGAIGAMSAECKDAGGRPGASPGLIRRVDLNADGRSDYVIDTGAFDCQGAASLFVGAGGGGSAVVFIASADGGAKKVFEQGAAGVRVEQGQLWLAVGGPLCGQKVTEDTPRSEMQACWRPLQWDAGRQTLDFGPLSSVRPHQ